MGYLKLVKFNTTIWFSLLLIFLFGLVLYFKTFSLHIFGDEWQTLWYVEASVHKYGNIYTEVNNQDFRMYEIAAYIVYLITQIFGYSGTAFYFASYLSRFFTSCVVTYFIRRRGGSLPGSLAGGLLFLITPVGMEATDWVKNLTSFLSIGFFLISLDLTFALEKKRNYILSIFFFFLSIFVNPIRAFGILMTYLAVGLFLLIFSKPRRKILAHLAISIAIFLLLFVYYIYDNGDLISRSYYQEATVMLFSRLFRGDFLPLAAFLSSIGNSLIPRPNLLLFILYLFLMNIWKLKLLRDITRKMLFVFILSQVVFIGGLYFVFSESSLFYPILLGSHFVLFLLFIIFLETLYKKHFEATVSIIVFGFAFFSMVIFWIKDLNATYPSEQRYLIYPAVSLPLIVGLSLVNLKRKIMVIVVLTLFIVLTAYFYQISVSYISGMYRAHNKDYSDKVWQQISGNFKSEDFKKRTVFLITSDDEVKAFGSVKFGFGFRMAIDHGIWDSSFLPIAVSDPADFKSMLTDGEATKKHFGEKYTYPKENGYYFDIKGDKVTRMDVEPFLR